MNIKVYAIVTLLVVILLCVLSIHKKEHFSGGDTFWSAIQPVEIVGDGGLWLRRLNDGSYITPYYVSLTPQEVQGALEGRFGRDPPAGLDRLDWLVYKPRTIENAHIALVLQTFFDRSGLGSKGLYIQKHRITHANFTRDEKTYLMSFQVSIFKKASLYAFILSFDAIMRGAAGKPPEIQIWNVKPLGIVHEQYFEQAMTNDVTNLHPVAFPKSNN
jgi:hypothetical protein